MIKRTSGGLSSVLSMSGYSGHPNVIMYRSVAPSNHTKAFLTDCSDIFSSNTDAVLYVLFGALLETEVLLIDERSSSGLQLSSFNDINHFFVATLYADARRIHAIDFAVIDAEL